MPYYCYVQQCDCGLPIISKKKNLFQVLSGVEVVLDEKGYKTFQDAKKAFKKAYSGKIKSAKREIDACRELRSDRKENTFDRRTIIQTLYEIKVSRLQVKYINLMEEKW